MFPFTRLQKWIVLPFSIVIVISVLLVGHLNQKVEASAIGFRPPFNDAADGSTYRITYYFDHYYPNYTGDPDSPNMTVYTGETVEQYHSYSYRGHPGYDFGLNIGVSLYAVADGVATIDNNPDGTLGRWVCIQQTPLLASVYGHMNTMMVV